MKINDKFIIECRYEYWSTNGKEFCDWFIYSDIPMIENDINKYIKEEEKKCKEIDKKTKCKREFRTKNYDIYVKEQKEFNKQLKNDIKKQEKYFASEEYKELQRKKRQSAKERKEKQKKYLKEHEMLDIV